MLQEVDSWWRDRLEALADELPGQRFDPLSRRPGVAVLLADGLRVRSEEWRPLHGRPYVDLLIEDARDGASPGSPFRLAALHALPPRSALLFRARTRQLEDVRTHLRETKGPEPLLVVGDFNTTPWSPSHRKFTRELNLRPARRGFGLVPTWPTWNSLLQVPIDHILLSPGGRRDRNAVRRDPGERSPGASVRPRAAARSGAGDDGARRGPARRRRLMTSPHRQAGCSASR